MLKFIEIFHIYEQRDVDNMFTYLTGASTPHPKNPNTSKLWFIGVKLWGKEFIDKEFVLRRNRLAQK